MYKYSELVFEVLKSAVADPTAGSNTRPTDSINLRVTLQHKSGTALIWCDSEVAM